MWPKMGARVESARPRSGGTGGVGAVAADATAWAVAPKVWKKTWSCERMTPVQDRTGMRLKPNPTVRSPSWENMRHQGEAEDQSVPGVDTREAARSVRREAQTVGGK